MLNTLYYTDAITEEEPNSYYDAYDAMKRKKWLHDAYHEHLSSNVQSSSQASAAPIGPKASLLKLIEFNKIALLEVQPDSTPINARETWWFNEPEGIRDESALKAI